MSRSTDVFPPRNLGAGEHWGRTVETRVVRSEQTDEKLTREVNSLSTQINSLAGTALTAIAQVPIPGHAASTTRGVVLDVSGVWSPFDTLSFVTPPGAVQVVVEVMGTLQLTTVGSPTTTDAPWVRVRGFLNGNEVAWVPDSQGVRAASNPGGVFLATVATTYSVPVAEGQTVSCAIEGWSSSATDFATTNVSNLSSLSVQVQFYKAPILSAVE